MRAYRPFVIRRTPERGGATMTVFSATVASERSFELAEGPLWDHDRRRVLWVDINAGDVHHGALDGEAILGGAPVSFDETIGAVATSAGGELLVAGRRDLYRVDLDGRRTVVANLLPIAKNSRLNDGACDPAGRFLVGSLSLERRKRDESLFQLGLDGKVTVLDDDVTLSNGLGWSPDGSVLYSVDTIPRTVWARPYDVATGASGERSPVVELSEGHPDGLCVDTAGNLWIAIWGQGEVRCYTAAGDHLATVALPVPNVSSVAFVGERRDVLLITTAREHLSAQQLRAAPLSGRLFTAQVGVTGVVTAAWSGA